MRLQETMRYEDIRVDHRAIAELVDPRSTVLDLGCGNGGLLHVLIKEKDIKGQGIDINEHSIYECVTKGLAVSQSDIDSGLSEYGSKSFDYVILNQSLQQVKNVDRVLKEALRVGKKVIVGFPNFAYYKARFQMVFKGKAPVTGALPYQWHETPNLHFLSISDFVYYCRLENIRIQKKVYLGKNKRITILPNIFAQVGIFLISEQVIR